MKARIDATRTLDELLNTIRVIESELAESGTTLDQVVDVCNLPIFGGEDLTGTENIWSWDEDRILTLDDHGRWTIDRRN